MPSTFDVVLCLHVYKDLGPLIQSIIFWRMWEGGGAGKRGWNVEMLSFFVLFVCLFFFCFVFFVYGYEQPGADNRHAVTTSTLNVALLNRRENSDFPYNNLVLAKLNPMSQTN